MKRNGPQYKPSEAGDVVREYCRRFPSESNRALGRKLFSKYPSYFTSAEHAEGRVRYHRGRAGEKNRKTQTEPIERVTIPEPEASSWRVHDLPSGLRWLVLADTHCPYHDRAAIETAVRYGKDRGCNAVLIDGDLIDFYKLSRFNPDPRHASAKREIEVAGQLIDYLRQELAPQSFVWKFGNHEVRWEAFLRRRAAEILDIADFDLGAVMRLADRGVELVEATNPIRYSHLTVVHGHEWQRGLANPVNPARGAFLRTFSCCLSAHQHQTSNHTETTVLGNAISCWSLGCLCELHPEYAALNRWNHGFALLHTDQDWSVENLKIIDGSVKS